MLTIIYLCYYLLDNIDFYPNRKKLTEVSKACVTFNISKNILTVMSGVCI